ncbi:hypothetical protein [Gelidibacter gilvus]|uniref:DUF4367 domain-containing protein n=1 Tax=Gelidibacter gilvus TaxID=59602 RepID=A0A4Q0XI24_9FLAO|nr:hypothetical protein [Gelidibacter gilvus]RXJ50651.1 hypothetical protein ESZ48_07800 [Gelidibacter gilvus]
MKNRVHLLLITIAIVFISCKEDKDLKETSSENSTEIIASHQSKEKPTNATNFKTYSGEELNNWLPAKILEYVKEPSSLEFGSEELHQVTANYQYKGGYDKYITLEITNGQSPQDLRIKNSIIQRIEMNFAEDSESGYTKIHKRNNIDVFEMQGNYNNSSTLQYVYEDRFYVRLDGSNVKADELWSFADQLNFKTLTQE